ncbi:MAG: ABC transporter ATP-binding protein/permease [Desulfobacterales bacterium]|nr:ABC transporter ATP-binding protein/permease [Desulfobacterales bacterium]MDX2512774.1 ABC transporter ATP-binding protein/permease [Desulfobacterales bacterium]
MPKADIPVVKRSLLSWIFPGNVKLQLLLLLIIAVMVFARVLPLEMQKRVVNEAINLRKVDLLVTYCGIYLIAVVCASGLKFLISIIQTLISERSTARMRKDLYAHILTLPLGFFRKTQAGLVVNTLTTELTLPGNFVGLSIAAPVTNLLTLFAFAGYLLWLNWVLALVSLSIYPIVVFLVPLLQKRANRANKKRVDAAREFSSRIAESVSGIHEIQGNGAHAIENRKYNRLVDNLLKIRIVWSLYRFGIKSLNGFFTSLGPFLVFILGGWLAIKGQLELGALVAFVSAQEKLFDPWKELIEFYQVYQDGSVNYKRTMEYFDEEPDFILEPEDREPLELDGRIETHNLSFVTESGISLIDNINLSLISGEHMALVGFSGSGKSTLAACIGQLYKHTGGKIQIGGQDITDLSKRDIVNNIGVVAQSPFIFDGTIEENILYSCEARLGVTEKDLGDRLPTLDDIIATLHQTGLFVDVLRFGLNTVLARDHNKDLMDTFIRVRKNFQQTFGEELTDYVEFFDQDRYLHYSSVAENLTFGTPNQASFSDANLCRNPYFLQFLDEADLTRPLLSLGVELVKQSVDILRNLPQDAIFFNQSPIEPAEMDDLISLVDTIKKKRLHDFSHMDRQKLLDVVLRFTPGTHKMVSMPQMLENLILEGRSLFRKQITEDDPGVYTFYQMSEYIFSQTILSNIFFGKTTTTHSAAQERIDQSIIQLLVEEDLLERVIEIGMHYDVGSKGDNLSGGQRQKLAIARAFLKSPRILIMDEATSALDNRSQARILNLLETRWKKKSTLISVVHRLDTIQNFDKVAVMKAGKILEMDTYNNLMDRKGTLYELVGNR